MHEHVEVPGRTMTDSESGTVAGNVQLHSPCFAFHDFLVPLAPCRSSEYFLRNLSRSFFFLLSLSIFIHSSIPARILLYIFDIYQPFAVFNVQVDAPTSAILIAGSATIG